MASTEVRDLMTRDEHLTSIVHISHVVHACVGFPVPFRLCMCPCNMPRCLAAGRRHRSCARVV